jgi:hypothetical protein
LPDGEKKETSSIKLIPKVFSIADRRGLFPENEISPVLFLVNPRARTSPPRSESRSGVT